MLDILIHKHIDEMELLENKMAEEVDDIIDSINLENLIDNPIQEMMVVKEQIADLIVEKYIHEAVERGIHFAKKLDNLSRDIKVADSNDPHLNKELFDDQRRD